MEDFTAIKQQLQLACLTQVNRRIATAEEAMLAAEEAANEETKSSAGDKYETGRAMMQLERDKNKAQWLKALHARDELLALAPEQAHNRAAPGSLVLTDQGKFYFASGLGKIKLGEDVYFAISSDSPIGHALHGKQVGDRFGFQDKVFLIESIG